MRYLGDQDQSCGVLGSREIHQVGAGAIRIVHAPELTHWLHAGSDAAIAKS
jgi:hypothetical protein